MIAKALNVNPAWLMGLDVDMVLSRSQDDAIALFEKYSAADPRIQAAVDALLKDVPLVSEHQD